jgi:glycosyltransferase involved in cell wall biosynthesis
VTVDALVTSPPPEQVDSAGHDQALAQRLRAAAEVLIDAPLPPVEADPWRDAAQLLDLLVAAVRAELSPDRMWLLMIAVSTAYPEPGELREAVRQFELLDMDEATVWLMRTCLSHARRFGSPYRTLRVVDDGVVVDVNFSARYNLHTGIQRVVRTTLPRWQRDHDLVPVAWTKCSGAMRTLMPPEQERIFAWQESIDTTELDNQPERDQQWTLIVPWRSVVVLAEVPMMSACARLAAMAELSGNEVVAVGYDCIPIVSADLVPLEADRFVRYLSIIRNARRVAGISISATTEFQGFADMLPTQGLSGPHVFECLLPIDMIATSAGTDMAQREPLVVTVGSFEPRKNHLALLNAAETLWREGHHFRLLLIGGGGDAENVRSRVRALRVRGRPISVAVGISDAELAAAYRRARFTVFASLHEGYGLPAAESLSLGTPVITSNYGSTLEIAEPGGAVLIDPRDDGALIAAMRELLTDDGRVHQLRAQIRQRPTRTWDDYAAQLWTSLVLGETPQSIA